MHRYDAANFDPPAPIAKVALRSLSDATVTVTVTVTVTDVILLIDTGADITLLPRSAIARLEISPDPALAYDLIGFDGTRSTAQAVDVDMVFLRKAFRGRYLLLLDDDRGILGRDVLASLILRLDGPAQGWSQQPTST